MEILILLIIIAIGILEFFHYVGGWFAVFNWPVYLGFIIWSIWSISTFFGNSSFAGCTERISILLDSREDDNVFIIPTSILVIYTTIINTLYLYAFDVNFLHFLIATGILIGLCILLISINFLMVKIIKNQDYLLVCELQLFFSFYFLSFFLVLKSGTINNYANFWVLNAGSLISVLLLLIFINSVKSLRSYFFLYCTCFLMSLFIFLNLLKLELNIWYFSILIFTSFCILLFLLFISNFLNSMPKEDIFFPDFKLQSSIKDNIVLSIILFPIVLFFIFIIISKNNILFKYNYILTDYNGINKEKINISISYLYFLFILFLYFIYLYFFVNNFFKNIKYLTKCKEDLNTINESNFSFKNEIKFNEYGNILYIKNEIINEIIKDNNFTIGLIVYNRLIDKNIILNMYLTCFIIDNNRSDHNNILIDNFDLFLIKLVSASPLPDFQKKRLNVIRAKLIIDIYVSNKNKTQKVFNGNQEDIIKFFKLLFDCREIISKNYYKIISHILDSSNNLNYEDILINRKQNKKSMYMILLYYKFMGYSNSNEIFLKTLDNISKIPYTHYVNSIISEDNMSISSLINYSLYKINKEEIWKNI